MVTLVACGPLAPLTTSKDVYKRQEEEYLDFVCFNIQKDDPNYPHVEMRPVSQAFYRYYTAIGLSLIHI